MITDHRETLYRPARSLGTAVGHYLAARCFDSEIAPRYARAFRVLESYHHKPLDVSGAIMQGERS